MTTIPKKAIIIPGNGCGPSLDNCMWYPTLARSLRLPPFSLSVPLTSFPDPLYAREHIWVGFAEEELMLDEETIVVGHSSGAACALRLMEKRKVGGCLLVSAYDDDLGDEIEKGSGYFSRPFDYKKMRENCPWIVQFHSKDDHLVPVEVGRRVAKGLREAGGSGKVEYVERERDGHFQDDEYPMFEEMVKKYANLEGKKE